MAYVCRKKLCEFVNYSKTIARRVNVIVILAISLCLVFIFHCSYFCDCSNFDDESEKENIKLLTNFNCTCDQQQQVTRKDSVIDDVVNYQRQLIARDMENYEFPNGTFGIHAKNLQELTPETGGTPMRSIIFSTWRSGSTFLGDVINALPGNFYHFEPLMPFGNVQIRDSPNDRIAVNQLTQLLKCNYTGMDKYLKYGQSRITLFRGNTRLWTQCIQFPSVCWRPKFLEPFCKLYPMQSMKVVRMRMQVAASLLRDSSLNVRIVLLIRDPRGTMHSRAPVDFCVGNPDCEYPNLLCGDMVSDYHVAVALAKEFPMTFKAVRYEDFSLSTLNGTQEILQFYGLSFHESVSKYLDSHTKARIGDDYTTFRDSKSTPLRWVNKMLYAEVKNIQDSCKEAMRLWGYKEANNASELLNKFNPLLPFPVTLT